MRRKYTQEEVQILKDFGLRVRDLREAAGLSQAALETDAKMSKNQVGRIERGEISTSIVNLHLLAQALNVPIKYFFESQSNTNGIL
ncbi:helix-turn-helix domain-containing protein [Flagellimonas sp. SN16]|uniref:helix-turn-helix domain-containing protein n=1 Tax=Flagellimonas sp. SN16 TaxID=3415142 RepID=UPI003C6A9486